MKKQIKKISSLFFSCLIALLLVACQNKDDFEDELSGTIWTAKIDMVHTLLPTAINKNEQHYYRIKFTATEYSIDMVDSNGVAVLHEKHGSYRLKDGKITNSSSPFISMIYYIEKHTIYSNYYGLNFLKQ